MRILKALASVAAADILSLFIVLTLAVSASTLVRGISAVCTAGIMICIVGNHGLSTARQDIKSRRISGGGSALPAAVSALTVCAPGLVSWVLLKLSTGGGFEFYRWHKLINGYFLQIYNFIEPDASSAALTGGQVWAMLPLALAPGAVYLAGYLLVRSGAVSGGSQ